MIRPNESYLAPRAVPGRTGLRPDRSNACRAIKPVPISLRAQLHIEPRGSFRVVQTDVLIEVRGLEAELHFREPAGIGGPAAAPRSGTATASLLFPGEHFIPPRSAVQIPGSAGAILGIDFRDGELEPFGKVVPILPRTEGTVSIDASFDILAAIGVNFSWVDSAPPSKPEILVGGELRFLRGVIGRLVLRTESPSRLTSHRYLNVKDVTLLRPGQTIHFPEQFVPVHGEAGELVRIRYRFGEAAAGERRGADA